MTKATTQRPNRKRFEKYDQAKHWFPSLPFQQFQVLFNSLFKVLCIFPSRYLYAIGLPPIFSFRWNLPPTLSCNPKQLDSLKVSVKWPNPGKNGSLTLSAALFQGTWPGTTADATSSDHNSVHLCVLNAASCTDSHGELSPLQSPLLGGSLLVSFPPLNYMLKFSG